MQTAETTQSRNFQPMSMHKTRRSINISLCEDQGLLVAAGYQVSKSNPVQHPVELGVARTEPYRTLEMRDRLVGLERYLFA